MKVLHLLSSNKFSGAENVACQIIRMFRDDGEKEFVYCSPDGPIRQALADRDVTYVPLAGLSPFALKRVLREVKPDVVHAHDMKASFLAAISMGRIPLISHIHNNNFDSQKPTLKAILYRFAAAKAKHIFWVSKAAQEGYFFRKGLREKSSILYNVIDTEQLRQKADQAENKEAYDVIYLGRMTYQKNIERLLDVSEKVIAKKPDARIAMIGTGEMEEDVRKLIADKNIQANVDYLGFMSNPYGILQNAKVMLMTSRWEGLPMCALESLALGVPIVSTPTDGLKELLEHGKTGFLSNVDEVLAEKLVQLLDDRSLQQEMAENAMAKAKEINDTKQYITALLRQYMTR